MACDSVIAIDLSLRTTACVVLNNKFEIVDCCYVTSNPKEINNEELILHNTNCIFKFISKNKGNISCIAIEGLSFNSLSADKDLIAGNFWYLRTSLHWEFGLPIGIIPVKSWRQSIVTKDMMLEIKDITDKEFPEQEFPIVLSARGKAFKKPKISKEERIYKGKKSKLRNSLVKEYTCKALPEHANIFITDFIKKSGLKMSIFDNFADAYFIAKYRLELEN